MPKLVIFGGLPATGKSTLARTAAAHLGAMHLRIDTIEQAIVASVLGVAQAEDAGYRVGYAVAAENLRAGRHVVADSVNPLEISREGWREAARGGGGEAIEIEIVCSDPALHRTRAETRPNDIAGHTHPTWAEIEGRDYEPWATPRHVIDTARLDLAAAQAELVRLIGAA